jgi:hypothetical protein
MANGQKRGLFGAQEALREAKKRCQGNEQGKQTRTMKVATGELY